MSKDLDFLNPVEGHESLRRNFPKDQEFFHARNLDDYLLCCMAYRGNYDPEHDQVYINIRDWKKIQNMVIAFANIGEGKQITPRTLVDHRKALEKLGYITEDVAAGRWIIKNYYEQRKYTLLFCDVLWHLITTGNRFVLKIYLYLLDGYEWQQRQGSRYFTFTFKQLRQNALGYSGGADIRNDKLIKAVLYSLATQGLITFTKEYFYINGHCDTDFVLQHVSTTMAEAVKWTMTGEEVEDLIHYVGKNKQPQPSPAAPAIEEPPREQIRIEEQPRKKRIHYDYDDWLEG